MKLRTMILLTPSPNLSEECKYGLRDIFFDALIQAISANEVVDAYSSSYVEVFSDKPLVEAEELARMRVNQFAEANQAVQDMVRSEGVGVLKKLFHFHSAQVEEEAIHVIAFGEESPDISIYSQEPSPFLRKS